MDNNFKMNELFSPEDMIEQSGYNHILKASFIDTKLGFMLAIADNKKLYLLEFSDRKNLKNRLEKLMVKIQTKIISGTNDPIESIKFELYSYFKGNLTDFNTPLNIIGSTFEKIVWEELMRIPYGQTRSYMEQAQSIGRVNACRAVANANGTNHFAIVIPCHRVIKINGELGGYAAGLKRKEWLINHEKMNCRSD